MNNPICNTTFDSLELIEYRDYLQAELIEKWLDFFCIDSVEWEDINLEDERFEGMYLTDIEEYNNINDFIEELEGYGDFAHGATIIHEDHFTEWTEQFVTECYDLRRIPEWVTVDWEDTADTLKQDYVSATFDGEEYYMRA